MNTLLIVIAAVVGLLVLGSMAPAMAYNIKDALSKVSRALPASTSAVTATTAIDAGKSGGSAMWEAVVAVGLSAPAVATSQFPASRTSTYDILPSDSAAASSTSVPLPDVIVQTGAGRAG